MLFAIIAVLMIFWLLGFTLSVGGSLIHLLLLVVLLLVIVNMVNGRRMA